MAHSRLTSRYVRSSESSDVRASASGQFLPALSSTATTAEADYRYRARASRTRTSAPAWRAWPRRSTTATSSPPSRNAKATIARTFTARCGRSCIRHKREGANDMATNDPVLDASSGIAEQDNLCDRLALNLVVSTQCSRGSGSAVPIYSQCLGPVAVARDHFVADTWWQVVVHERIVPVVSYEQPLAIVRSSDDEDCLAIAH